MLMRGFLSVFVLWRKQIAKVQSGPHATQARPQGRMIGEPLESRVQLSVSAYAASPAVAADAAPWCVRTADVNADGHPDMLVLSKTASTLDVYLGTGVGTSPFQSVIQTPVGTTTDASRSFVVSDVNGDGTPDVVVTATGSNVVRVLKGSGDGHFTLSGTVTGSTGSSGTGFSGPFGIAIASFGGARPDLLVTNSLGNTLFVMPELADGTFGTATSHAVGAVPVSIAVGNFNGDSNSDIAVANFSGRSVSVLYGKSDGTFQTQRQVRVSGHPECVVAADFNGDGATDLAVSTGDSFVRVLIGTHGADTFSKATNYHVGSGSLGLVAADINGDGKPDLAVANYNSNSISVLTNIGGSKFGLRQDAKLPLRGPRSIAVADVNNDHKMDLAVVGSVSNQYAIVWTDTAATGISLSKTTVPVSAAKTRVAALSGVDNTPNFAYKFALVKGTGSEDNGSFKLQLTSGSWVLTARKDLVAKTYHIRLRLTDPIGSVIEQTFDITVSAAA